VLCLCAHTSLPHRDRGHDNDFEKVAQRPTKTSKQRMLAPPRAPPGDQRHRGQQSASQAQPTSQDGTESPFDAVVTRSSSPAPSEESLAPGDLSSPPPSEGAGSRQAKSSPKSVVVLASDFVPTLAEDGHGRCFDARALMSRHRESQAQFEASGAGGRFLCLPLHFAPAGFDEHLIFSWARFELTACALGYSRVRVLSGAYCGHRLLLRP
jgi:hypothetical protein